MEYNFFLPSNLDIDNHIRLNKTSGIAHFKKEKVLYCIHLLTAIRAHNKDVNEDNHGRIPIHASILRDWIGKRYHLYLDYLVKTGIFTTTRQFSTGASRRYAFTDMYRDQKVKAYKHKPSAWMQRKLNTSSKKYKPAQIRSATSKLLARLPLRSGDMSGTDRDMFHLLMKNAHPSAYNWYDGLKIDELAAKEHNDWLLKYREAGVIELEKRWNRKTRKIVEKDPITQWNCNMMNIQAISNKNYILQFDANVFRMYTPLTMMPKELRPYIRWKGEELVSIDISNSQPYLLALLLNSDFWQNGKNTISFNSLPYSNHYKSKYPISTLITMGNSVNKKNPYAVQKYRQLVAQGKLYESMATHIQNTSKEQCTRDQVKTKMFLVLFTNNEGINMNWAKLKRDFRDMFPEVYQVIEAIQANGRECLPTLLQRIESYIIYEKVLKRIEIEYPKLPVFTIHDSIVTLKGAEGKLSKILEEELLKATGLNPNLKIEHWDKRYARYNLFKYDEMYHYTIDNMMAGAA